MYGEGGPPGHHGKPPESVCACRSFARAVSRSAFAMRGSRTRARSAPDFPPFASSSHGVSSSCHLAVGVRRVPRLEPRVALRQLLRHRGDRRIVPEDGGHDPGREETVQGLLGALVGVVDQVRQRREHRIEELSVDRDDELLVDARRVVRLRHVGEGQRPALAAPQRRETRLRELHAARQHRHRPPLAVGEIAGDGRGLDRVGPDPPGRRQSEASRPRPLPSPPRTGAWPARARGRTPRARSRSWPCRESRGARCRRARGPRRC